MKKFLSVILAALVITAAGCSGSGEAADATTTTTAAQTEEAEATTTEAETTTAAEEEDATEEVTEEVVTEEAETTPAETEEAVENPFMTDEIKEFIEALRAEVPIYADFMETTSTIPMRMGMAYEADIYGTGELTAVSLDIAMASPEKIYMSTVSDGTVVNIIIRDNKYYMISEAEKTALYMEMSDEEALAMSESMASSVKANFDASAATYETGETEYNGETYLYEKVITDEVGEIIIYADTATKEVKYLTSAGETMEITILTNQVDDSLFEIPADYTMIDMATLYQ